MSNDLSPLCVLKQDFNYDFITNLGNQSYLRIIGDYCLTKSDYDNLVIYSNVSCIDVNDIEDFSFGNEIKINLMKKVEFNSLRYKKFNIDKVNGYTKNILSINLPFRLFFVDECLYNEENDFEKLLSYLCDIETLNINFDELGCVDEAIKVIYKIEDVIGKKIKFINFIVCNRTIDGIEKLLFLEDDRLIKIWYEDGINDCSINEFITMRKNIDSIINDVKSKNLSVFESVIYVYDIVKKFNYNLSDFYSMDGRQLHKIFTTNNIVCSGYARLISEILNELGIQAGIYKLTTKNNVLHTRSLVYIVDPKYNINSLCSMEPTWESALNEECAYSLFLTPLSQLKKFFPNDHFRDDIDVLLGNKKISEISLRDKISLYQLFNNKDLNQNDIDDFICKISDDIDIDKFFKALVNVRVSQGFSRTTVVSNLQNILDYNRKLTAFLNNKLGTNVNFFLN